MQQIDVPISGSNRKRSTIHYTYGSNSNGEYLAAVDGHAIFAILAGDDRSNLLEKLRRLSPNRVLTKACPTYGAFIVNAVAHRVCRPN